ncbi:hypothetical protein FQN57_005187 [Myotisia sp. PD_48]|nr:hypothetical protein FQN57_005187 [Myotisia sp. PD_48]
MANASYPLYETLRYGDHSLQTISVCIPRPLPQDQRPPGYWIVYIHGGAWRDPKVLASSFQPAEEQLLNPASEIYSQIAGTASIDYRLSAHPKFPQDPDTTSPTEYRNAKHPDHLHDVVRAIALLQQKYHFGGRYLLVGHSCGATLAFQTVMPRLFESGTVKPDFPQPVAIVGVAGIYHLPLLIDTYADPTPYEEFIHGAFGADAAVLRCVSPAFEPADRSLSVGWTTGSLGSVVSSCNDELVDDSQRLEMGFTLDRWCEDEGLRRVCNGSDLKESHDDIWSKGTELAAVIYKSIKHLQDLEQVETPPSVLGNS